MNQEHDVLKDFNLRLRAKPLEDCIKRNGIPQEPTLSLIVKDNLVKLRVYTNKENDKNKGMIDCELKPYEWGMVLEMIDAASRNPEFGVLSLEEHGRVFMQGKMSDKPLHKASVIVGRDGEGQVFISVTAYSKERPKVKFVFAPDANTYPVRSLTDGNMTPAAGSVISELYARSYVKTMRGAVEKVWTDNHKSYQQIKEERQARKRGGGGGNNQGGGYGNNNNSGGNQSSGGGDSSGGFDEDIPW